MITPLINRLNEFLPLEEEEIAFLKATIPVREYPKGTVLLESGQLSQEFFFGIEGCVRMYYSVEGEEKTAFFYTENTFISSYRSFVHQIPAQHSLECIEPCKLAVISMEVAYQILSKFPKFETLSRMAMEEELAMYQEIVASYITLNPEQRYIRLRETRPDLITRVPQHALAAFIGVTPESLSRIRKRIRDRE